MILLLTPKKFCDFNPSCLSRTALISSLLEDEKYQRDAFAAQLIKQDSRHKQICSQVEQIQNELASLTMVEMTKRDLQVKPFLYNPVYVVCCYM